MANHSARTTQQRPLTAEENDVVVLTKSELACFKALDNDTTRKTRIALATKLDLLKTSAALEKLERLGFIRCDERRRWRPTKRGRTCTIKAVPDRARRGHHTLGRGGERLLQALDRPMRCDELAARLGVTKQRIYQLAIKLYAGGYIRLGDENRPLHIIARRDDPTMLLSWEQEHVLSVVPQEFATSVTKIRVAANLSEPTVDAATDRLLAEGLIQRTSGPRGEWLYQITAAGLAHPQYSRSPRAAGPPRLPVESDRVLTVLSHISKAGQLRIRDISGILGIPLASINALFQYLKRKSLVQKRGGNLQAPYMLTDQGNRALAEMIRRRSPVAVP
jgi:DNA-binding IclR family transcriptional regulator